MHDGPETVVQDKQSYFCFAFSLAFLLFYRINQDMLRLMSRVFSFFVRDKLFRSTILAPFGWSSLLSEQS